MMNDNIEGIEITELKIISDHRGSVMHMLRNDSKVFEKFGEIYFSTVTKNGIKAWQVWKILRMPRMRRHKTINEKR